MHPVTRTNTTEPAPDLGGGLLTLKPDHADAWPLEIAVIKLSGSPAAVDAVTGVATTVPIGEWSSSKPPQSGSASKAGGSRPSRARPTSAGPAAPLRWLIRNPGEGR